MPQASGLYNGQISGPSSGTRKIRVMRIGYSLDIISSADSEGRSRRAFYPVTTEGSSFMVSIGFVSWEERESFNQWMNRFMTSVSEGTAKNGVVTVRCPSRNFIRTGVPQGPLVYGEGVRDLAYYTDLNFSGAYDPTDPNLSAKRQGASFFEQAANNAVSQYFYPAGVQVKGAEATDSTLFGDTPDGAAFGTVLPSASKPQVLPGMGGM